MSVTIFVFRHSDFVAREGKKPLMKISRYHNSFHQKMLVNPHSSSLSQANGDTNHTFSKLGVYVSSQFLHSVKCLILSKVVSRSVSAFGERYRKGLEFFSKNEVKGVYKVTVCHLDWDDV